MRRTPFTSLAAGAFLLAGVASAADYPFSSSSSDPILMELLNTGSTPKEMITIQGLYDGYGMGIYMRGLGEGIQAQIESSAGTAMGARFYAGSDYSAVGIYTSATNPGDYGYNVGGEFNTQGWNNSTNYGVIGNGNGGGSSYNIGVYGGASSGSGSYNRAGYFNGDVALYNIDWLSDRQFKTNIHDITGGLGKVMALKPRGYDYKVDEYKGRMNFSQGSRIGFVAQELEEVLPELVHDQLSPVFLTEEEKKNKVKKEGIKYKSVDYVGVIPVLVAAVQEQQALIESMRAEIASLKAAK